MSMSFLSRTLIIKQNPNHLLPSIISPSSSFLVKSNSVPRFLLSSPSYSTCSFLCRVSRPLTNNTSSSDVPLMVGLRYLCTQTSTSSSLNDPSPNWNNCPPKENILLDGCDFEHWLIVLEKPQGEPSRDEIIDTYIKTLAQVVGSEEEARMKIYSVSIRHYFAFGCLVPEELSYKIKELPRVRWVLPDSYFDVRNKDYGGEPFINGQAVPYDPKYHEEWERNLITPPRRPGRLPNFDRSRNIERSRANMGGLPGPNMQQPGPNMQHSGPSMGAPPNANVQHPVSDIGAMQSNIGVPPNANMLNSVPNYAGVPSRDALPNAGYTKWCKSQQCASVQGCSKQWRYAPSEQGWSSTHAKQRLPEQLHT